MSSKEKSEKKELPIPDQIGKYQILSRIAVGGMGETYLAQDPFLQRKIVIKRARPDLTQHQIIKDRFQKEVKITSSLFHPSIIPVYAVHKSEDQIYYTMPFVEGKTLKQILRDNISDEKKGSSTWSINSLLRIFINVCNGLSYCHSKGILHRDLKPENILVGEHGQVFIVDWGLATHINDDEEGPIPSILNFSVNKNLTRPGKVFGTLPYLPPERITGTKANISSEIYSLGVILYQLLTLRMPFHRRTIQEYKLSKKYHRPLDLLEAAPFRNISQELEQIVKKCLDDNPKNRFESVDALLEELEDYEEGNPSWIFKKTLDISDKDDWEIQENILSSNLSSFDFGQKSLSWKYLMIAKEKIHSNQKLSCQVSLKENCAGVNFCFNIPEKEDRSDLEDGYLLHIGSEKHKGVSLKRNKVILFEKTETYLASDKSYLISIERKDQTISLYIDNIKIFSYEDYLPIVGSCIGFSCEDMDFELKKIDLFVTSSKKTAGCLAIPNSFMASKHFKDAIEEYSKIALSFKGQTEAHEALFRSGVATIYLAKQKRWHLTKNSLFEKAFAIFDSLQTISTAPLALLGKSLIYKEKEDLTEEGKCLELALHRYKDHPLIHLIHKQIHTRLHECAFAVNQREGVYLFALLILSHCRFLLDFKETHTLILGLPLSHNTLYFLNSRFSEKSLDHLYKKMIVSLSFHLGRENKLKELFEQSDFSTFKDQIIFCLMYLGKKEKHFSSPGKLIKDLPEAPGEKHFWPLYLKIEQGILKKDENAAHIISTLESRAISEEMQTLLTQYKIEHALITKDKAFLKKLFKDFKSLSPSNPLSFLYGCYLTLCDDDKSAHEHFAKFTKTPYPPLSALAPLYIEGKISLNKEFLASVLPFEKITLYKNLFIYYTCLGKSAKADYYIHKTLSNSPWIK
ncbi:MAG: Serine/threonine-protein kinase PknD [Chlamydiia bacterium]|nr:Serine/threonine-protein kinase PknD [Chlamydiia bacterium]